MVVRYLTALGLIIVAGLALATHAEAAYEELEFTPVITDAGGDGVGFTDIREIAFAEPGDDTLVIRFTLASMLAAPAGQSVDLFWTTPAGDLRHGIDSDMTCDAVFTNAVFEENVAYCAIPYDAMGASVGVTLASPFANSYTGTIVDYAPGDTVGLADFFALGDVGEDYTLVGSTLIESEEDNPLENATDETSEVIEETIEGASAAIDLSIDEPSEDVYVYYWSSDLEAALLFGEIVVEEGSVILYIEDGEGTILLEEEYAGDVSLDEAFDAVTPGEWTISLELYGFVGSAELLVEAQVEDKEVDNDTGTPSNATTGTNADGNSTADPPDVDQAASSEESPGVGILLLAGVAAIAVLRRR